MPRAPDAMPAKLLRRFFLGSGLALSAVTLVTPLKAHARAAAPGMAPYAKV